MRQAAPRRGELPASYEAERAVLASALLDSDQVKKEGVYSALQTSDFFWEENRIVWDAVTSCVERGEAVTLPTVAHMMAELGTIDRLDQLFKEGAEVYLVLLNENWYSSIGCSAFARMVKKYSERREAINRGARIVREAYQGQTKSGWVK